MKLITNTTLLALTLTILFGCKRAQPTSTIQEGYILKAAEGEKVMGNIFIKADPRTGSTHASMFTMTVADPMGSVR